MLERFKSEKNPTGTVSKDGAGTVASSLAEEENEDDNYIDPVLMQLLGGMEEGHVTVIGCGRWDAVLQKAPEKSSFMASKDTLNHGVLQSIFPYGKRGLASSIRDGRISKFTTWRALEPHQEKNKRVINGIPHPSDQNSSLNRWWIPDKNPSDRQINDGLVPIPSQPAIANLGQIAQRTASTNSVIGGTSAVTVPTTCIYNDSVNPAEQKLQLYYHTVDPIETRAPSKAAETTTAIIIVHDKINQLLDHMDALQQCQAIQNALEFTLPETYQCFLAPYKQQPINPHINKTN
eukprot:jgi/Psemu1/9516/gm1.9516_g